MGRYVDDSLCNSEKIHVKTILYPIPPAHDPIRPADCQNPVADIPTLVLAEEKNLRGRAAHGEQRSRGFLEAHGGLRQPPAVQRRADPRRGPLNRAAGLSHRHARVEPG